MGQSKVSLRILTNVACSGAGWTKNQSITSKLSKKDTIYLLNSKHYHTRFFLLIDHLSIFTTCHLSQIKKKTIYVHKV